MLRQSILLVGDDVDFFSKLGQRLEQLNFDCSHSFTARDILEAKDSRQPDAAIADAALDGSAIGPLCRHLNRNGQYTPVLVCTDAEHAIEAVYLYESGAEDYFAKRADWLLIEARIRRALRRRDYFTQCQCSPERRHESGIYVASADILHGADLTRFEERLLQLLRASQGQTVSTLEIGQTLWGRPPADAGKLYELVHKLRTKLEPKGWTIINERAKGYRLERISSNHSGSSNEIVINRSKRFTKTDAKS